MALAQVTEKEFEREVLASELPVLLEFGAAWCGPCKIVAPELEALARELEGKAKIVTVDIDKSPLIAREMGVQSVPTFVVFNRGRPEAGRVGALKKRELREMLEPFLPRAVGAIKPEELSALIAQRQVCPIDTREPAAFGRAHLPGAVNMPLEEIKTRLAELYMLPGAPVVYCRAGDKSKELTAELAKQEVPVHFLEGGLLAWEAAGLPVERP
jgi:thioredoxin 1/putative thioredoxin